MADPTGFLKVPKIEAVKRPVEERVGDWREVYERQDPQDRAGEVSQQARRCMDCGIPFCHSGTAGCPLGNLIPDWNDLVRRGRWDAASERLHAINNFPEFTGRLCPAPCEAACVLSIAEEKTGGSVTIKRIENTIVDQAWRLGLVEPQPAKIGTGKSVAVLVGWPYSPRPSAYPRRLSRHGLRARRPAWRSAALWHSRVQAGKGDAQPAPGPDACRGNTFRHRLRGGVDLSVEELRTRFDALVLAVGALRGRDSQVEGRHLNGVHLAMEHLVAANRECEGDGPSPISAAGKHVVIIGGGDTADRPGDCAPPRCSVGDPVRLQTAAARGSRRVAVAVANVAAGVADLAGARRRRPAPFRGNGAALPRRRAARPARHGDRQGEGRACKRWAADHHPGR